MAYNETLQEIYLDYTNNYLTQEKFAEHNGLSLTQANTLLKLAKEVHETIVEFHQLLDNGD